MNQTARNSGHLNDEQLIAALYLSGDGDLHFGNLHLAACKKCSERMTALQAHRLQVESCSVPDPDLSFESLNARRRAIYASLSQPVSVWARLAPIRWVSAVATTLVLGGGLILYQGKHQASDKDDRISDAQLALEVSQLSQGSEVSPTQPLQELFE